MDHDLDLDLGHPFEGLYRRELSGHYWGPPLECKHCRHFIHDDRYVYCDEEREIFLHKPCVEVLHTRKQISHHPCHPQHPLTLTLQQESRQWYACGICRKSYDLDAWLYTCESCSDVKLHASCVAETLPDNEDEVVLQHTTHVHKHPLFSLSVKLENRFYCPGCRDYIFGEAYACYQCGIFFHKICIDAPQEIQRHPFHPQHPLKLVVDGSHLSYSCMECGGNLPFYMSALISTLPCKEEDDVRDGGSQLAINYFAHEHPLSPFHATKQITYECRACKKPIMNGSYGCFDCRFLIHESCAKAPSEIQHYLHNNHSLSLIRNEDGSRKCECCANILWWDFAYHCKACNFALHMECALKTLAYLEEGATATIRHFSHQHELTLSHHDDLIEKCYVCSRPEKGPIYRCHREGCQFSIHESCQELPSTVQQSSHSHPFTLRQEESGDRPTCDGCGSKCGHLMYSCAKCELNFDIVCAFWERPTLKICFHEHDQEDEDEDEHEHEFAYFSIRWTKPSCKVCGKQCFVDLLCCDECKISVHYDCAHLLSKTMKSKFHVDPLTLYESLVEDAGENYCDICEGKRDSELWVYYCASCEFFAHVKCAMSLVRPKRPKEVKENPELPQLNEKIACVQREIDAMEADMKKRKESLFGTMINLEVLKTKHAEVEYFGVVLLRHPSHPHHALYLRELSGGCVRLGLRCECCRGVIHSGFVYCCDKCRFFLHKPCGEKDGAELLVDDSGKGCGTLPSTMSTLTSTLPCKQKDDVRDEEESRSAIQHFAHEHPLNPYHAATEVDYKCEACDKPIANGFYFCAFCRFLIHESCAKLPSEIQHYLHANHPLSFVHDFAAVDGACKSCAAGIIWGFAYSCKTCNWALHVECALKTLAYSEEGVTTTIQNFSHWHELTLYHLRYDYSDRFCYGCSLELEGPVYQCRMVNCGFFIHKSCLELPLIVQQASHSHPLTLCHEESEDRPACNACGGECGHFMFSCAECNLNLDVFCAFSERLILEVGLHKHNLFYVVESWAKSQCTVCGKQCGVDHFYCRECWVSVHYSCVRLLSKIIVSNHHIHPLTLYKYIVEDNHGEYIVDDDSQDGSQCYFPKDYYGEQNCDICGEGRDPHLWAYYCTECKLVAHVKCATSPVRFNFKKQKAELRLLEKEIGSVRREVDAMEADILERQKPRKDLSGKLEALKEKREDLASQS